MKAALPLLLMLLPASAAIADPRDDALSAMLRCSALADRNARLGCYDATIARAPNALNPPASSASYPSAARGASQAPLSAPPPAPAVAARPEGRTGFLGRILGSGPSRAPQTTVAQFGSESIASGGAKAYPLAMDGDTIDQISARVTGYAFDGGFITVTLDNGQVWRQTPGNAPVGHLARPALAYAAVIARGSLSGSYTMRLSGVGAAIAVRRIR
jgi:hypothetical protein